MSENVNLSFSDKALIASAAAANIAASNRVAEASKLVAREISLLRESQDQTLSALELVHQVNRWLASDTLSVQPKMLQAYGAAKRLEQLRKIDSKSLPTIGDKELRETLIAQLAHISDTIQVNEIVEIDWLLSYPIDLHYDYRKSILVHRMHAIHGSLELRDMNALEGVISITGFISAFALCVAGFALGGLWVGLLCLPISWVILTALSKLLLRKIPATPDKESAIAQLADAFGVSIEFCNRIFTNKNNQVKNFPHLKHLERIYNDSAKRYNEICAKIYGSNFTPYPMIPLKCRS